MNQDQPVRPANIANIVAINQGIRPLTISLPNLVALSALEILRMMNEGAICIDCRSQAVFGTAHIPGAYNVQVSSSEFEQRVGWVAPQDRPICLIAETTADAQQALHKLAFVGLDSRVVGYLSRGMEAWLDAGLKHSTVPQISIHELREKLETRGQLYLLDVREKSEWDEGHVEEAKHLNFKVLGDSLHELDLEPEGELVVICASGMRSSTACSILLMNGYSSVYNTTGGTKAWIAAGYPVFNAQGLLCRR